MAHDDRWALEEKLASLERERAELVRRRQTHADGGDRERSLLGSVWAALGGRTHDADPVDEGVLAVYDQQIAAVDAVIADTMEALRGMRAAAEAAAPAPAASAPRESELLRRGAVLTSMPTETARRIALADAMERLRTVGRRVVRKHIDTPMPSTPHFAHGQRRHAPSMHKHIERAERHGHAFAMEGARTEWQTEARGLLQELGTLGVVLPLPGMGPDGQRVEEPMPAFARGVELVLPDLDTMIGWLREEASGGGSALGGGGGAGDASALQALVDGWEALLKAGEALDRAATPGARTVALLVPVAAWNRQAETVGALARTCGLPLEPPVNQGGELHAFVGQVREGLPRWRDEVEALRAML